VRAGGQPDPFDIGALGLALSAAHLGAFEWNRATGVVILSEQLREMLDWSNGFGEVMHPDDREPAMQTLESGIAAEARYRLECRLIRPSDGSMFWASSTGVLVKANEADPGRIVGLVQDITPAKLAQEQREVLAAELDHRVKNVLSAVQSVAAQSARKAISLDAYLKTFSGRLKSMASAHALLTATRWRGASMGSVAAAELGGIAPGQTRWEGPDLLLTPRAAQAMSLALHELAINAVKFGALSVETGRVDVRWISLADGGLELQWTESFGPRVAPRTRRGFGATLLEEVTGRELEGDVTLDFRREGVSAVVRASASAITPPLTPEPAPAAAPEANTADAGAVQPYVNRTARIDGLRLLIVEDALLLALELEAGLEEAGATIVGSAADVGEAMALVDRPLDAAVLDANLNGASVMPVAEALAARGVPFVFATGYGDSRFNIAGFDAPVIRKPYDVTQVAAALAEVTGRS
jgi:two-component sensor histidine kinase/CheY-like chemotaxis protein